MPEQNDKPFVKWYYALFFIVAFGIVLYAWIFGLGDLNTRIIVTIGFVAIALIILLAYKNQEKQDTKFIKLKVR
ncbi:hypothetical protein HY212_01400 [Candidatus Pacearchaeota archaeon]|nr:hypothetical protein [Candidatus Pacearchaeota archaeon]